MSAETNRGVRNVEKLRETALAVIGETNLEVIATLPKNERNTLLKKLKDSGLSVRQIERLTGIGRGIIQKVN